MNNLSEFLRPFGYGVTKYRVMNVTKNKEKGSVAFYIDARDVMDRLDEVVGCENWQDKYTVLAFSDSEWVVECTLVVNGVAKTDVGSGDAPKDAYSDALKRAAVKFGVGRYLYDMDTGNWFPIDEWKNFTPESKKQIDELLRKNLSRLGAKPAPGGNGSGGTTEQDDDSKRFHALGVELYGTSKEWDAKRPVIVEGMTKGRTKSSKELTPAELAQLIKLLDGRVQAKRAELAAITLKNVSEMQPA
jgi:hypothetical protein